MPMRKQQTSLLFVSLLPVSLSQLATRRKRQIKATRASACVAFDEQEFCFCFSRFPRRLGTSRKTKNECCDFFFFASLFPLPFFSSSFTLCLSEEQGPPPMGSRRTSKVVSPSSSTLHLAMMGAGWARRRSKNCKTKSIKVEKQRRRRRGKQRPRSRSSRNLSTSVSCRCV